MRAKKKEFLFAGRERNNFMVSIVLPTYNGEKYLRESIDSILEQSYTDWELFIVDDCSTDGTMSIAKEYERGDPRITVIHNRNNMRLPTSLNIGFENARGDYLTWTSDDNRYNSVALEQMVTYLEEHDCPLVCAEMDIIDDNGNVLENHYMTQYSYDTNRIFFDNIVRACFLYRREILDTVGKYNKNMFGIEDYDYWLRIFKRYRKIGHIEEHLYYYRVHSQSLTTTKKTEIERLAHNFRMENLDYLVTNQINNPIALVTLFCESVRYEKKHSKEIFEKIRKIVPELGIVNIDHKFREKYIIYGAGEYGKRTEKILGDKAEFFADRNARLVNCNIEGKKVLSLDEMKQKWDGYFICISLGYEKIYDVLCYINSIGCRQCVLCYQLSDF